MAKPVKITDFVINLPWKNQVFWISLSAGKWFKEQNLYFMYVEK